MFRLWIEWDLGQADLIFTSEEKAKAWLNDVLKDEEDLSEDYPNGYDDLDVLGLCSLEKLIIV